MTSSVKDNLFGHAADRLMDAMDMVGAPVCVGIDPVVGRLPEGLRSGEGECPELGAIRGFVVGVLDAVAECVPCVKFQSACFERYGGSGVGVLAEMNGAAKERGLEVILDAKRGDIGISAEHYAAAAFGEGDDDRTDWITINSYLGEDGIEPFLKEGHGAFALVRTSNPGSNAIQGMRLEDGRTVAELVGGVVAEVGKDSVGERGYSSLGAVVGATKPEDMARLREVMPQQIFLVPGYGAQGGTIADIKPCFDGSGHGALITASRSVIYAFEAGDANWFDAVGDAAKRMADEVGEAVGWR